MREMVDALTQPLTDDEKHPKVLKRPKRPRLLKKDTVENYKRMFIENGWTDGMPIELPTEEKVAEMLTGIRRPWRVDGESDRIAHTLVPRIAAE